MDERKGEDLSRRSATYAAPLFRWRGYLVHLLMIMKSIVCRPRPTAIAATRGGAIGSATRPTSRAGTLRHRPRATPSEDGPGPAAPAEAPAADSSAPPDEGEPGFWWDPSYSRWVRDDKRGVPLSEFDTVVQPAIGEAYTVWPAVHTFLSQANLASLSAEEVEARAARGDAVVVDVRPAADFERDRIAGSVNVPLYRPVQSKGWLAQVKRLAVAAMAMRATERNPDFLAEAKAALGPQVAAGRTLVVACTVGGTLKTEIQRKRKDRPAFKDPERAFGRESRSLKACYELLFEGGFDAKQIAHLDGGIAAWRHEQRPMEP